MASLIRRVRQTPNEVLDYGWDWSDWLAGDIIQTSSWFVGSGVTIDADSKGTSDTTVWLSGMIMGTRAAVTNRIVTTAGRTAERTFYILGVPERFG